VAKEASEQQQRDAARGSKAPANKRKGAGETTSAKTSAKTATKTATKTAAKLTAPKPATGVPSTGQAAALIVAHNQARRIAATVRATRVIPGIEFVLVVDDGSQDNTQDLARKAGAVVVRHSHRRGRSASIETGAAVIAMRDEEGAEPRVILIMEPGLGNAAIAAAPLVEAVLERVADMAIGLADDAARHHYIAARAARKAIAALSGWSPLQPLSKVRCLTREALEAAFPLSRGAGLEAGLTLDVLDAGLTVTEVACDIRHRASAAGSQPVARAGQYRDVMMAISSRRVRTSLRTTQHAVEDTFHVASNAGRARRKRSAGTGEEP
jgi:hypothetical protein